MYFWVTLKKCLNLLFERLFHNEDMDKRDTCEFVMRIMIAFCCRERRDEQAIQEDIVPSSRTLDVATRI